MSVAPCVGIRVVGREVNVESPPADAERRGKSVADRRIVGLPDAVGVRHVIQVY